MVPKMKKIHSYMKKVLVILLILALVGTNLLTSSITVYATDATEISKSTDSNEAQEESSQEVAATEDSTTDTTEGAASDEATTNETVLEVKEESEEESPASDSETSIQETGNTENNEENESEAAKDEKRVEEDALKKEILKIGDKVLAEEKTYHFGSSKDISKETLFHDEVGYGFSDVGYPEEAAGWVANIYYPREVNITQGMASYVEDGEDYASISSKVWTETESTGYGVYTYEETSTLDFNLEPANYNVKVTLVNPTNSEISTYLEAEDITKASDIKLAAGETTEVEFIACLVDEVLNLKFLGTSSATAKKDAATKTVYVKSVSFEKVINEEGSKPTIFIASDSTVQTYEDTYYPQMGWGQQLYNFFGEFVEERECEDANYYQCQTYETANVIIENRAIGGRSSKSFIEEGKLDDLLEDVKPGDYLLVQWGHNDATYSRPNRYVSADDFEKWMQYYVDGATQRGATCVLVTPVARYSYKTLENGELDTFISNFEAYRTVMQKISSEQNIPLVDLTELSIELCNSFGIEGAKSLFLQLAAGEYEGYYAGGVSDATHLQYYGAYKFAQCVAKGILSNEQLTELASNIYLTLSENTPAKPANLATTSIGASSISMTWDAVDDAELYYVYRQVLEDGQTAEDIDFTNATKYSVSSKTSYTDSSCEGGKTYVYALAGFNELGIGELSDKIIVSTKASAYKFDFGISSNSNVMSGWTEITENQMYTKEVGYGFIQAPGNGRNRAGNNNADSSPMADDFCLGEAEFALDLSNGDYEVTIYAGDLLEGTSTIKASYTGEGISIGTISTKMAIASITATVRVTDGQLNIGIGGTNPYINGMEVTPILGAPIQLSYSEMSFTTTNASFLINFTGINEASYYNVYQKASTDKSFSVIKKIQAADLDELSARAMTATLGETYQYYVTAVIANGTESAASNTIEIEMLDKSVALPKAPQNVTCDSAENGKITISWDNSDDAFSYIIYRSSKAETDKGFKAFTKVGTSTSASYTDINSDLTTNIHYYYKVQGKNAGGVGALSEACETPINGELVAAAPEKLTDRGVVAVNLAGSAGATTSLSATDEKGNEYTSGVYVSWRSFETDFDSSNQLTTRFSVYRNNAVIANDISITNLVDEGGKAGDIYQVVGSNDTLLGLSTKDIAVWDEQYLELQLYKPQDQTMPDGSTCTYEANDMSVGDVDGDGDYELFVKWYPSNAKDNSNSGYTGTSFIDAYDIDMSTGQANLLYRVNLGVNIRSGAHYSPFQVWDFDGDNKAELAIKTADGTTIYQSTDGTDQGLVETGYVGACNADALPTSTISSTNDYRNTSGYVLSGPEYLTMFDHDGTILSTADYIPERGSVSEWGDAYGNRVDRFLSAVAYLDGQTPFAVFTRGYYTRTVLTAYSLVDTDNDGFGDTLDIYWKFDSNDLLEEYDKEILEAQGNHGLSINDVDNDGKDEIIYGSLVVDHDGSLKYSTGLGHGDAMHVSDWVEWNDGLEIMQVHEHTDAAYHVEIHDAQTGEILMGYYTGKDTGRGVAADIDPTYPAAEFWSIASPDYVSGGAPSWNSKDGGVYSTSSTLDNLITITGKSPAANFSIFWDGDLLSEIFDHTFDEVAYAPLTTTIAKWNYETSAEDTIFESGEVYTSNGTKGNAGLIADILGDWREEIILRCSADNSKIRVYTTTIQTDYVVPCLMENLSYREGVAWQNVGYNQPANLSYLLSEGLITAQATTKETTKNSVTLHFTPANDGTYGHEIQGYEVYRATADSEEYSLIASIPKDNLSIVENTTGDIRYSYTDTTASGGTTYSYKVAAIIDNKTSFLSRATSAHTLVDIKEVKGITLDSIVADTVLEEGQTIADLLPVTVTVVDFNDNEVLADVTWDVSEVDLSTPGTYKVYATVAGYSETVMTTLTIIENTITGFTPLADIKTIIGTEVQLPTTIEVTYLNQTTKKVIVTKWNGTVDNNKLGTYELTAQLEDVSEVEVLLKVIVVDDYVTSITESLDPIEVVMNSKVTSSDLPATVNAKYASGNVGSAAITWNTEGIDTSSEGVITITGSIEDYDSGVLVLARVVKYKALYKFDFGISEDNISAGWTGITVNPKYETETAKSLGLVYSSEKGYGFDVADETIINGRLEQFIYANPTHPMPNKVYSDFALPQGLTFNVDLENGTYIIELMSNSTNKSDIKGTLEDSVNFSVANSESVYTIGSYEVEVTDGQLNVAFDSTRTSRLGAIIIRSTKDTTPTDPTDPTEPTNPEADKFTVKFQTNGGSEISEQVIESEKLVAQPVNPVKTGYTFEGWYQDKALTTQWNFENDKITKDTTLYAKWSAIRYVVTFNSNGGSEIATQSVIYGEYASAPSNPTKSGYTFEGWYRESSLTTKWNFTKDKVSTNTILYAKWNAIQVGNIKLNKKSLIIGVDSITKLLATVTPNDAANKNILWSSSNSKVASVNQSGVVTAKKRGTAVITATSNDGSNVAATCKITVGYKITYKLNGGTNHAENPSGFVGSKAVKLNNPTKKGYSFKGWYTDKNYKNKITKIKKGTKKNLTIYAKWEKITVEKATVKALTNSGKGKMKVTLNKVSGAKGYEIVYATNSKFTKNVTKVITTSKSKTFKNLTKRSTYYVKVRAYKVDASGNKIYGKYSAVSKVQIKK